MTKASMRLHSTFLLVLFSVAGSLALEAAVEVLLPNGTKTIVVDEEDAIDLTDAAAKALPEDNTELKNLLNWAISELSHLWNSTPL